MRRRIPLPLLVLFQARSRDRGAAYRSRVNLAKDAKQCHPPWASTAVLLQETQHPIILHPHDPFRTPQPLAPEWHELGPPCGNIDFAEGHHEDQAETETPPTLCFKI